MDRFCLSVITTTLLSFTGTAAAEGILDAGFEPPTTLHAWSRSPGDPWLPGEWNAETANIIVGAASLSGGTIYPWSGAQMLRMNPGGGSASQANQVIALEGGALAPEQEVAYSVYLNAEAATSISLILGSGDGQTSVGTLTNETLASVSLTTDDDLATWEHLQGTTVLPAGTTHLALYFASGVAQMPASGIYLDEAEVSALGTDGNTFLALGAAEVSESDGTYLVALPLGEEGGAALKKGMPPPSLPPPGPGDPLAGIDLSIALDSIDSLIDKSSNTPYAVSFDVPLANGAVGTASFEVDGTTGDVSILPSFVGMAQSTVDIRVVQSGTLLHQETQNVSSPQPISQGTALGPLLNGGRAQGATSTRLSGTVTNLVADTTHSYSIQAGSTEVTFRVSQPPVSVPARPASRSPGIAVVARPQAGSSQALAAGGVGESFTISEVTTTHSFSGAEPVPALGTFGTLALSLLLAVLGVAARRLLGRRSLRIR